MLHTKGEATTRTFGLRNRKTLDKYAINIHDARRYAEMANDLKNEVRGALMDIFYAESAPTNAAYHVETGVLKGQILCLDMGVRYKADMGKLSKTLGDRLQHVTVTEPVFNTSKAKAAIESGIVTEAELAKCVTALPTMAVQLRQPSDGHAPKGIEPGEARVTPLKLAKGVKLE